MTKPPALSKYVQVDVTSTRLNRIWASVSARLPVGAHSTHRWWQWVAVAAVLGLSVTAFTWRLASRVQSHVPLQSATLETAGDGSTVDLVDGSRLELAARTRLEWVAGDNRTMTVRLIHGSVVCDLVSIPGRRFSVLAADVQVQVTGTRFSVDYDPEKNHVDVGVQRGSVSVVTPNSAGPGRRLLAGERWSIDQVASKGRPSAVQSTGSQATEPNAAPSQPGSQVVPSIDARNDSSGRGESASGPPQEPPSARSLLDQGNAARRAGDARAAASAYQTLLSKYPHDARAGLAAFELGRLRLGLLADMQGAVRAFQSAIALAPGSSIREDSMAHLVEAYAASGQMALCEAARDAYLKGYPNGVHASVVGRQCGAK